MTNIFDPLADPRYSTASIASATGVPAETIRTWFKRKVISFDDDRAGKDVERIGLGRNYSAYTAMVVAVMGKLTAGGMTAANAKMAAYHFVYAGQERGRDPGMIYEEGETLMVIANNEQNTQFVRIINAGGNGYGDAKAFRWDELFELFPFSCSRIEILALTELWQGVTSRLEIRSELESRWKK